MSWREWKKNKIKNKKPYRFQIVTNGPNQWIGNGLWLLATVHRQRFKASPVRTRRSVAVDLETESGLISDGEWLWRRRFEDDASTTTLWLQRFDGDASTASFDGDASTTSFEWRRFRGFVATVNGFLFTSFDGDASRTKLRRRASTMTLRRRASNGDASVVSSRRWMGFSSRGSTVTLRGRSFDGEPRRWCFDGELRWRALTANGILFFCLGFFLFLFGFQWFLGEWFFFLAEWVNGVGFLFGTIYSGI